MGTLLMLTVGTNPLPVWVALHHLKDKLPAPIYVRLVHTKETRPERDRLLKYSGDVPVIDTVETVSGNPATVRNDITQEPRAQFTRQYDLHSRTLYWWHEGDVR